MGVTPCTLKHITLIEVTSGVRYTGPVNNEGLEKTPNQGVADPEAKDQRYYFCSNCMQTFPGDETFDICKAHLGTFPLD